MSFAGSGLPIDGGFLKRFMSDNPEQKGTFSFVLVEVIAGMKSQRRLP
jgi:hypothetical protein